MTFWASNLGQTAVHWVRSATLDDFGQATFAGGVEIAVRWEEREELFVNAAGEESRSHAVVYASTDMADGDYLFLGDLDDLSSAEEGDPLAVSAAREVRAYKKSPRLKTPTEFLRKAWL